MLPTHAQSPLTQSRKTPAGRNRNPSALFAALAVLALVAGCKATAENIEEWKGTMKGPGKIVAVLKSANYDLSLRGRAALALVEMAPRTTPEPLDPLAELQRAVQRLDNDTRGKIIEEMAPGLEALMVGKDTTPEQVRAKDAAFLLISDPQTNEALRKRLTTAVMDWYVADFNGRNLSGNYSAHQVIEVLGAPAAEKLVTAINREMPPEALIALTTLIGQVGNDDAKARAGERLVDLERSMESDEYLNWLKERIRESIREQWGDNVAGPGAGFGIRGTSLEATRVPEDSAAAKAGLKVGDVVTAVNGAPAEDPGSAAEKMFGAAGATLTLRVRRGEQNKALQITLAPRAIDEAKVQSAAVKAREERVVDGALVAMKNLNSVPSVATRLLTIAEHSSTDAAMVARRGRALLALEGGAREEDLTRLLNLALGTEVPLAIRDVAFDRVGDIRSKDAIPRIWPLLENGSYENGGQRLRWRAGEMILYIGGAPIVQQFLTRLPRSPGRFEPEELEGYAQRMSQMTPPPTALLRQQLRSGDWWKQVIALRYFQRKGSDNDVRALEPLKRSRANTQGDAWSRLSLGTVGDVASDAIKMLKERLSGDNGEGEES